MSLGLGLFAAGRGIRAEDGRQHQRVIARHVYLEVLEDPAGLGGLLARVADQHVPALSDALQTLDEGGMERKGHEARGGPEGPEGAVAAVVGPLPQALELVARGLPLVKFTLSDLTPPLQARHSSKPPYPRVSKYILLVKPWSILLYTQLPAKRFSEFFGIVARVCQIRR